MHLSCDSNKLFLAFSLLHITALINRVTTEICNFLFDKDRIQCTTEELSI